MLQLADWNHINFSCLDHVQGLFLTNLSNAQLSFVTNGSPTGRTAMLRICVYRSNGTRLSDVEILAMDLLWPHSSPSPLFSLTL